MSLSLFLIYIYIRDRWTHGVSFGLFLLVCGCSVLSKMAAHASHSRTPHHDVGHDRGDDGRRCAGNDGANINFPLTTIATRPTSVMLNSQSLMYHEPLLFWKRFPSLSFSLKESSLSSSFYLPFLLRLSAWNFPVCMVFLFLPCKKQADDEYARDSSRYLRWRSGLSTAAWWQRRERCSLFLLVPFLWLPSGFEASAGNK